MSGHRTLPSTRMLWWPEPGRLQTSVEGLACSDVNSIVPGEVLGLEVEGNANGDQEGGVGGVHSHGDEAPGQCNLGYGVDGRPSALVPAQRAQPRQDAEALHWVLHQ